MSAEPRSLRLGIAVVTLIMVLSSIGLVANLSGPVPVHSASFAGTVSTTAKPHAVQGAAGLSENPSTASHLDTPASTVRENPVALNALAAAKAAGVPVRDVLVPRAGATPAQVAQARAQGHVTPLYTQDSPAPLGLAYYGLSANPNGNGSMVATTLNSPSLLATFDPNATGVQPVYPFSSSTDAYGVQLNAVTTRINLFGNHSYSFWTQNVAEYYPFTGTLYLVTNVWNFSGPTLSANAIYAHGPYGQQVGTSYYYAEYVLTGVTYPFNLDLWMNNSVISGRNAVNFTVGLQDGAGNTVLPYDYVVFNSTAATMSDYSADGQAYNAFHLTNDFEVILGGPGGGSQADLFAADANITLQYWNTTTNSYEAVPAAYSYGGETGETVTGATVGWETNATGSPYGVVRTGPGFLQGLWNATGAQGLTQVTISVHPSNAFIFLAPNWTSNFTFEGDLYWAPQELDGGIFYLAPGQYNLSLALSDFTPLEAPLVVASSPVVLSPSLVADPALGIYTPLWAWQNAQYAALSTGGTGASTNPYKIENSQTFLMGSIFGIFNDYTFPVYTAVFFWGTTASVVMSNMPSMATTMPYTGFPANDLGYLLYNTTNIALVNSDQISGWFTSNLAYTFESVGLPFVGNFYGTFSVELWNATFTLIANDTFLTQAAGLALVGGNNNTVWGNVFTMVPQPAGLPIGPLNLSLGVEEAEQGDRIYNNIFDTTYTAVNAPVDLYSGLAAPWVNTWNITPTAAATVNYATGFPEFPLTGTIIRNATQGGNYWWDYGSTDNPVGTYPYDEYNSGLGVAQIYNGGDYYPLVYGYAVGFAETGLPPGLTWTVTFSGVPMSLRTNGGTDTLNFATQINGTFGYSVADISGWHQSSIPYTGTQVVSGLPVSVILAYTPVTYAVTFTESGLPTGTNWSVTLNSAVKYSLGTTIAFAEPNGSLSYSVGAVPTYTVTPPASGTVIVASGPENVAVAFTPTPVDYTIAFVEAGLPAGTNWSVTLESTVKYSTNPTITFSEPDGSYTFSPGGVPGYSVSTSQASPLTVSGSGIGLTVTYAKSAPAPAGFAGLSTLDWALIAVVIAAIIVALVVALLRRGRRGSGNTGTAPYPPSQTGNLGQPPPGAS